MKGKLVLLMVGALAVGCSQSALADCKVENTGAGGLYNGNVWLNYTKHDAPAEKDRLIVTYKVGDGFVDKVRCNKDGGWIELEMVSPNAPAGVYDAQQTSVPGVGVKLTAEIAKNDFSGTESVVLTNGSFTSRRWEIPASEDTLPRYFAVAKYPLYEFWAIGPKDPKAGSFGGQPILKVRAGGDEGTLTESVVFGFSSDSQTIATCNVLTTSNKLSFTMPEAMTNHLAEDPGEHGGLGRLSSTKVRQGIGRFTCDSDLNVQFTISDTGNLHPGTNNVLDSVKGDGYTEGLGATFQYNITEDVNPSEENKVDVIFGQPIYLRNGDIGSVSPRLEFNLYAYYYRFGDMKPGQFQSTAVLNIEIQ